MTPTQLDELYSLASQAEILRAVVEDQPCDQYTVVSRKLEMFLGASAGEEPWLTALAPVRRARWLLHTVPLPTNHSALGLHEHLIRAASAAKPLGAGSSEELRYWVNEVLAALKNLLDAPSTALSTAVAEMLADNADASATLLLVNLSSVSAVQGFYARQCLPFSAVLTPMLLRDYAPHENQLTIGASRLFPDWTFTAPRAELITVVHRASSSDRDEITSALPVGGLPPVRITGPRSQRLSVAAFAVEPPPVNWAALRPAEQEHDRLYGVRARAFLLAEDHSVLLEATDGATVFTVMPEATTGEVIARVPTSTVERGDFLLLRQKFGDEDGIVQLANRNLGSRAFALRGQQAHWKNALRRAVQRDGVHIAERRLRDLGCTASNMGRWLSPDGIRTQRQQDFKAICLYSGLAEQDGLRLWQAMGEIHGAHIKAGHQMRELLERQLERTDLAPLQARGRLEVHLSVLDAGSLAIYRVEAKDDSTVLVQPGKLRVATVARRL